jgi:glutathione peroxidase
MADKVHVKGEKAHPFYRWSAKQLGPKAKPRWNFHKYLIAPDGTLVAWFSTPTAPTSSKVTRTIEKYLSKAPKG